MQILKELYIHKEFAGMNVFGANEDEELRLTSYVTNCGSLIGRDVTGMPSVIRTSSILA